MGKKVVLMITMLVTAGAIGWRSRDIYVKLKTRKIWNKLNEDCNAITASMKKLWPEAFDEGRKKFLEERGDELDEDFRKQIEQM